MKRQAFVELADRCETCGGDGSHLAMFDANCPAAWAHQYVEMSPTRREATEAWISAVREQMPLRASPTERGEANG